MKKAEQFLAPLSDSTHLRILVGMLPIVLTNFRWAEIIVKTLNRFAELTNSLVDLLGVLVEIV